MVCTLQNQPARAHHDNDVWWDGQAGRIQIVVDCRVLSQLMSGNALLSKPASRPVFIRMGRSIATFFNSGILPRVDVGNFIEWRPRRFNPVADHFCNVAMDARVTAEKRSLDHVQQAWRDGCNLQLYSDGGVRSDGSAALGWAVYTVTKCQTEWLWTLSAWSSQYLQKPGLTPFECEAMALEDGLHFLSKVVA